MLDSIMPLMGWVAANLLIGKQPPVLLGNDNFTAAPSGTFRTQDGYINIAANKQEQWQALCEVLGVPELTTDPRFEKRDVRKKNRRALTPLVEARLAERPTAYWVDALNARDVPSGAILGLEGALKQAQVAHRGVLQDVPVEGMGTLKLFGLTAQFGKGHGTITAPPPTLGAHTADVLASIGIDARQLATLKEKGVV
jgi:formyl-CoA transferase